MVLSQDEKKKIKAVDDNTRAMAELTKSVNKFVRVCEALRVDTAALVKMMKEIEDGNEEAAARAGAGEA